MFIYVSCMLNYFIFILQSEIFKQYNLVKYGNECFKK